MSDSEADTCRKYVLPKLYGAGWTDDHISEQRTITDGRIFIGKDRTRRGKPKRPDYLLNYRRDLPLAVIEAKASYRNPADGLQTAIEYAQMLGLKFAYATNGKEIVEHDFITGKEIKLEQFPSPEELWGRLREDENIDDPTAERLLTPYLRTLGKEPRYYQQIAINRTVKSILQGKRRVLLTMATGSGKTFVAFQIIWKLWSSRWNRAGEFRKPKILYLADRNFLIDRPKDIEFAPLGDARHKISGEANKGREVYFAIYQAIAKDERRPGLYREYPRDFFDLIVVDECHRGSARQESNWRDILDYFETATHLGMTATPKRDDNVDTYRYFGNPIYVYSLRQGIEDGFLAPYRVHRVVPSVDATGFRPDPGEVDRYGRTIPDEYYETPDFDTLLALRARTKAIARHLADFLKKTDRFAKTIIFCADQEHAEEMRMALNNENADLVRRYPDYVARIVSDEGDVGRGHLDRFMDVERATPVLVTTSKLLTTGVDVPTCKNIVLARVIQSMTDFKQIIGRGTRVRDDYEKFFFTILDYTGSATRLFADPEFDGDPAFLTQEEMNAEGEVTTHYEEPLSGEEKLRQEQEPMESEPGSGQIVEPPEEKRRKFYVDRVEVEIIADVLYELDSSGKRLRAVKYTEYAANTMRSMYPSAAELRSKWASAEERSRIIEALENKGIILDALVDATKQIEADPFDLLCNVAYSMPLRTRRERVELLKKNEPDFFRLYSEKARQVLDEILQQYVEHGIAEFKMPDVLKIRPISTHGNVTEISRLFGGPDQLRSAVVKLQNLLYI